MHLNTKKLDRLIEALSESKLKKVQVGVFGDKDSRRDENSNATIGKKHEFGEDGMPPRSFLRMPVTMKLQAKLEASGAFKQDALDKVIAEGDITEWMKKVGIVAEACIQDAFDSGGFGTWKQSNMKYKKVKQVLVETGQLRRSITSKVK